MQSAGSDDEDDEELEEDDELAFVQQHLYEGGEDSDDAAGNAEYKFNDFFVADKSERRLKARAAGKDVKKTSSSIPAKTSKRTNGSSKRAAHSDEEEDSEGEGDFSDEDEDEEDDEDEDDDEDEENESAGAAAAATKAAAKPGKVTATQQRNQALSSQIADLEEELMGAKPWELRGEVKASDRPENSFLELHADIERFAPLHLLSVCMVLLPLLVVPTQNFQARPGSHAGFHLFDGGHDPAAHQGGKLQRRAAAQGDQGAHGRRQRW